MRFVIARRHMTFPRRRGIPRRCAGWLFAAFLFTAGAAMVIGVRELRRSQARLVEAALLLQPFDWGAYEGPGSGPSGAESHRD